MDIGVSEYGKYLSIYIQLYQSIFSNRNWLISNEFRMIFDRVELIFANFLFEIDSLSMIPRFCRGNFDTDLETCLKIGMTCRYEK